MPYCPKCDMEFVDGITICSDCGGPLAPSREAADAMRKKEKEEALARERDLSAGFDDPYAFDDPDQADDLEEAVRSSIRAAAPVQVYVKKAQQYEDLKSSASAFFLVGGVLLILSVLCWTNIIPLPIAGPSRLITQGMMTAMAIGSLLIAVQSSHSAKKVSGQVAEEEQATRQLTEWFAENYTGQDLDTRIISEYGELSPEEISLKRFDLIQDILITNHDLADQAYVDLLAEEIYGRLFEE